MICRSTLLKINAGSFSKSAIRNFFGNRKPIDKLTFTRADFFAKGKEFVEGMSISGVQQKLSLIINERNEFEIVTINGTYILKPSPEAFPFAAENEQCAMAISHAVGIETAYSANIQFSDGEEAYITKRYDRRGNIKLHQEDLAQAFQLPGREKYERSYEEALQLARDMSGGKLSVVRDLFNRIVLAYIIGNDDMHLKNISLIKDPGNRTIYYDRLTPNYDQLLVQAFPNPPKSGFLALDLQKREKEGIFSSKYKDYGFYTGYDFYSLGLSAGLREQVVTSVLEHLFQKEMDMVEIINNSFMPVEMKERSVTLVRDRINALKIQ